MATVIIVSDNDRSPIEYAVGECPKTTNHPKDKACSSAKFYYNGRAAALSGIKPVGKDYYAQLSPNVAHPDRTEAFDFALEELLPRLYAGLAELDHFLKKSLWPHEQNDVRSLLPKNAPTVAAADFPASKALFDCTRGSAGVLKLATADTLLRVSLNVLAEQGYQRMGNLCRDEPIEPLPAEPRVVGAI